MFSVAISVVLTELMPLITQAHYKSYERHYAHTTPVSLICKHFFKQVHAMPLKGFFFPLKHPKRILSRISSL